MRDRCRCADKSQHRLCYFKTVSAAGRVSLKRNILTCREKWTDLNFTEVTRYCTYKNFADL